MADFDNDGDVDIVYASFPWSFEFLSNEGDGYFLSKQIINGIDVDSPLSFHWLILIQTVLWISYMLMIELVNWVYGKH